MVTKVPRKKSKSVAVLLAIIFGIGSWIYTWSADKSLIYTYVVLILFSSILLSLQGSDPSVVCLVCYALGIVAYIHVIVLALKRPDSFYSRYGEIYNVYDYDYDEEIDSLKSLLRNEADSKRKELQKFFNRI